MNIVPGERKSTHWHILRHIVGMMMHDDTLFAGAIADNISFHDETTTPERIEAVARLAQIHGDIVAMPMGYHNLVGDMGSTLSGGQRQRLLLARALYKQPKVLVLDEATCHLDAACENKINDALKALHSTRIMVAHRAETIRAATKVLFCQGGQLASCLWKTSRKNSRAKRNPCTNRPVHGKSK